MSELKTEEVRRLLRGELGDGETIEALLAQLREAGDEAVAVIRARLSDDPELRLVGREAWDAIVATLPEPRPLTTDDRDHMAEALRRVADLMEEFAPDKPWARANELPQSPRDSGNETVRDG
jgi:hypothetical protein